jgi:hypothetical protein
MQNLSQLYETISGLTRQFLNCWLEYVLSQPVDFDLSTLFYFLRVYIGFSFIQTLFIKSGSDSSDDDLQSELDQETMQELIPQESYS